MANFQISLDIPDVEIVSIEKNKTDDLIITVKSTKKSTTCKRCGKECKKAHGYGEAIILRHLPILDKQVYIRIKPARYLCEYCKDKPTTTEEPDWYNRRSKFTKAYEDYLMRMLINSTISDVSRKELLSYDDIEGVLDRQIDKTIDWSGIKTLPLIGLDEIAIKKGYKDFVVIVSTRINEQVKILAILPNRKKETVKSFLKSIPQHLKESIKTVCSDMYDGYINAVKEVLGKKVKIVIDRFHVAKHYRACTDSLRKQELKRLKKELTDVEYKKLKGAMWALRKKEENLTTEDTAVLTTLFSHSPDLEKAYYFQNRLTEIFNMPLNKGEASNLIKQWIGDIQKSGLICFNKFILTLNNYWNEILNYFHRKERKNSGFIEGLNNKIKVIKRRCYGIININKLFQRVFLDLEGYTIYA